MLSFAYCCGLATGLDMLMTLSDWRHSLNDDFFHNYYNHNSKLRTDTGSMHVISTKKMKRLSFHILTNLSFRRGSLIIALTILILPFASWVLLRWATIVSLVTVLPCSTKLPSVSSLVWTHHNLEACMPDSIGEGGSGCWLLIINDIWSVRLCICLIIASWNSNLLAPKLLSVSSRWGSTLSSSNAKSGACSLTARGRGPELMIAYRVWLPYLPSSLSATLGRMGMKWEIAPMDSLSLPMDSLSPSPYGLSLSQLRVCGRSQGKALESLRIQEMAFGQEVELALTRLRGCIQWKRKWWLV